MIDSYLITSNVLQRTSNPQGRVISYQIKARITMLYKTARCDKTQDEHMCIPLSIYIYMCIHTTSSTRNNTHIHENAAPLPPPSLHFHHRRFSLPLSNRSLKTESGNCLSECLLICHLHTFTFTDQGNAQNNDSLGPKRVGVRAKKNTR